MTPTRGRAIKQIGTAIRTLAGGRKQVEELAVELGCGRRTAYRVLGALEELGIDVERQAEGRDVFLRIRKRQALEALGLS